MLRRAHGETVRDTFDPVRHGIGTLRNLSSNRIVAADSPWVFVGPCAAADAERCRRLGLPVTTDAAPAQWSVRRTDAGLLELRAPAATSPLALVLELGRGPLAKRLRTARRDQPLPRAIGLGRHKGEVPLRVLDATAGIGRDALLLAHLGCHVVACERIPALAVLVDDAAARAGFGERLTVHCGDAAELLAATGTGPFDAVYLDPMFAVHGKAQVKKEMQVCRLIAGSPEAPELLLQRARAVAAARVVVKRHPQLPPLAAGPTFTVDGERVRFDVYVAGSAAP